MIRDLGRVDSKNAFLDTDEMERSRGITIFSKQAVIEYKDSVITLLDTPGHVDFSAEMERTLWVMDYAILVISAADGVSGHTMTLWKLLKRYDIPVFVFINKMDQDGADKEAVLEQLKRLSGDGFVDFSGEMDGDFYEQIAVCDEKLLERYLEGEQITDDVIAGMILQRKIYPCFFGSALKLNGVKEFLELLINYTRDIMAPKYNIGASDEDFAAKVFKVSRDNKGERLTFLKVVNGILKVKDVVNTGENEEKVNQIRIYSGEKFDTVSEVLPG
jgi:small GTP-binding protein